MAKYKLDIKRILPPFVTNLEFIVPGCKDDKPLPAFEASALAKTMDALTIAQVTLEETSLLGEGKGVRGMSCETLGITPQLAEAAMLIQAVIQAFGSRLTEDAKDAIMTITAHMRQ